MNKATALLFLAGLFAASWAAANETAPAFYVANWNVENLYDTVDDPDNEGDDEFLPGNPVTRWTPARYETKLDNLARVIQGMNGGNGPDILGIEEVENADVVRDLLDKLAGKSYGIVHVDSPDPRGIDTALIFNRAHFSLLESHTYEIELKWRHTTRDILHAVLEDRDGQKLHALVNHWPSRGGGIEVTEANRIEAARTLSRAVEGIFRREPAARVVVLGDFNDEPTSRSIRTVLDVKPYPSQEGYVADKLYNLASRKSSKGQGSLAHSFRGDIEWRMYDQIMASGALLQSADIEEDEISFWIDKPEYMQEKKGEDKGSPVPTFEDRDDYLGGYSDHYPVGARFVHLAAQAPAAKAPAEKPIARVPAKKPPAPIAPSKPMADVQEKKAKMPTPPAKAPAVPASPPLYAPVVW
ncbi:MAG TPA: hypothetical protein DCM68_06045 [Verrucomicrobia bacterium]|nr:hypothetical protein [Verrucomicrobiota bacterium]